jgi:UDP-N-acetyl-D-mannosaminuronate dehydrogenase
MKKREALSMKNKTVCILGLGYVGLPLPKALVIENK